MPLPPPKKGLKATIHKVFILDAQGGYAGEYTPDDNCVVEFGEFLAVVPEAGVRDGQSLFLGEWKATAVHGERMSLVAISKGQLGPEEVSWAKAALVAAEAHLAPAPADPEAQPVATAGPDKGVMESLASALDKREGALQDREKALAEAEGRAQGAWDQFRKQFEGELDALRGRLAAAQRERDEARQVLETERAKMREEMERIAQAPRPSSMPQADPRLEAMRRQNEQDRKYLQKYALELIAREERARDHEMADAEAAEKLAAARKEVEALRAEMTAANAQASQPSPEAQAQRRELEMRVKILQEKAFDLLQREEKLRAREQKLRDLMKSISA